MSSHNCPYCDYNHSYSTKFDKHLQSVHGKTIEEAYIETRLSGVLPICGCGCGEKTKWYGWEQGYTKFVRGHNAVIENAFSDPAVAKANAEKRKEGYRSGKYKVWNDGKTAESDERIKEMAEKTSKTHAKKVEEGTFQSWAKRDPEAHSVARQKTANTKKMMYALGELKVWNTGLSKETDVRVKQMSISMKKTVEQNGYHFTFTPKQVLDITDKYSDKFTLLNLDEYKNKYTKLKFLCKTCQKVSEKTIVMVRNAPVCYHCHPKESAGQIQLYEFVKSLCPDAVLSDRTVIRPKELDVYVPSKKVAVEYNGLYWHSEVCNTNKFHLTEKRDLCEAAGVRLINIFEDEWRDKREIVESMLRNAFGLIEVKYSARKCEVRELSVADRRKFFNANHLDGDVNSMIAFGLYFENVLISAMSLRKPMHNSKYEGYFEVARFASLLNVVVRGGLGKLTDHVLEYARRAEKKLLSYVDLRFGQGFGYEHAGWMKMSRTKERFWWTDFTDRHDRFTCKADAKRSMSENDVALERGLWRMWGCSNEIMQLT